MNPSASDDMIQAELAALPTLSSAIVSATQGTYRTSQLLLDITQGARVSYSAYSPDHPPALVIESGIPTGPGAHPAIARTGAQVSPWPRVRTRAAGAPQILEPGLLAASIPSGAAYAGIAGADDEDAVLAADHTGHITGFSMGSAATLPARIAKLREHRRLIVADLPPGRAGYAQLRTLSATRPADELVIVLQRAPDAPGHELLWAGVGGLGGGRTLTSQTTNQHGLIAAIDLAPTILEHLGRPLPSAIRGKPIRTEGPLDSAHLRALKQRLPLIYGRRLPALACMLCAWVLLLLASLAHPSPRARGWAMRVGGLAILWLPVGVLLPAALQPSAAVEYATLVLACFGLATLVDRLLPWPRAPLAPALTAVVMLSVDALAGTQLLMRSLLGPNPVYGARFYGIGNELKSLLAVIVLAGGAALLYPAARGRRAAATMALCGIVLAVIEGWARIGAGVGGVILVSAGTTMATVLLLPGALSRRRALLVLLSPIAGLVALAALDLATAHGGGHFTGSVLHARSTGDVRDILERRYRGAWDALKNGAMPYASGFAVIAAVLGVRLRKRLLACVGLDPAWLAALAGGLTAGLIGALTEDSGPVLLVVAVFALTAVLGYLWGPPPARRVTPTRDRSSVSTRAQAEARL